MLSFSAANIHVKLFGALLEALLRRLRREELVRIAHLEADFAGLHDFRFQQGLRTTIDAVVLADVEGVATCSFMLLSVAAILFFFLAARGVRLEPAALAARSALKGLQKC